MAYIEDVVAGEALASRGNPTVEVEALLEDGSEGKAISCRPVHPQGHMKQWN